MKIINDKIEGEYLFREDTKLNGMVTGNAIVPPHVCLELNGTVCGDLIVQMHGNAIVRGVVSGAVINGGGRVEIFGIANRVVDADPGAASIVHNGALVG